MAPIVSSEILTRLSVPQKIFASSTNEKPRRSPLTMPDRRRLVPVADSQLNVKIASSAFSFLTTGGALIVFRAAVQEILDLREAPGEDEDREEDPRHPREQRPFPRVDGAAGGLGDHVGMVLVLEPPGRLGLPELQEDDGRPHRDDRAGDVDDPRAVEVADEELGDGEAQARGEASGPDLPHRLAAGHRPDEPEGDEEGEERQLPAGHGRERLKVEARDGSQHDDRRAERAESDGRGVPDECDARRQERPETEADQHGCRDRDRRAEARGSFDESSEGEGDEQRLDPPVLREPRDRVLDDLEVTRFHREVVDEDRAKDDPAYGEETVRGPVPGGRERQPGGHPVNEDRDRERGREPQDGGPVRLHVEERQEPQQHHHRQRRDERRKQQIACDRRVNLGPCQHLPLLL
jgi:hypothetical protein